MSDAKKKPHMLRVLIASVSDGVENHLLDYQEGASSGKELATKGFAAVDGVLGAMKELARENGDLD